MIFEVFTSRVSFHAFIRSTCVYVRNLFEDLHVNAEIHVISPHSGKEPLFVSAQRTHASHTERQKMANTGSGSCQKIPNENATRNVRRGAQIVDSQDPYQDRLNQKQTDGTDLSTRAAHLRVEEDAGSDLSHVEPQHESSGEVEFLLDLLESLRQKHNESDSFTGETELSAAGVIHIPSDLLSRLQDQPLWHQINRTLHDGCLEVFDTLKGKIEQARGREHKDQSWKGKRKAAEKRFRPGVSDEFLNSFDAMQGLRDDRKQSRKISRRSPEIENFTTL